MIRDRAMNRHRRRMALAAAGGLVLAALVPSIAGAQSSCDWYAKTALKQQQDNERLNCGFKGTSWSRDFKAHMSWCAGVAPDEWKAEARKRDQQLAACARK